MLIIFIFLYFYLFIIIITIMQARELLHYIFKMLKILYMYEKEKLYKVVYSWRFTKIKLQQTIAFPQRLHL